MTRELHYRLYREFGMTGVVCLVLLLAHSVSGENEKTEQEPIKVDYKLRELERYQLEPRSTAPAVDPDSRAGRKRIKELNVIRDQRKQAIMKRLVEDPVYAKAWLDVQSASATTEASKKAFHELRKVLLPDEETMTEKLEKHEGPSKKTAADPESKEGSEANNVRDLEKLSARYREVFKEAMRKDADKIVVGLDGLDF